MTDWKGNIIQDRDTVVIYSTYTAPRSFSFGFMDMTNGGKYEEKTRIDYPEEKYKWEFIREMLIENNGQYTVELSENATMACGVSMLSIFYPEPYAICIKGKSDNQENYYKEYFKA